MTKEESGSCQKELTQKMNCSSTARQSCIRVSVKNEKDCRKISYHDS